MSVRASFAALVLLACSSVAASCGGDSTGAATPAAVPAEISAIMGKPRYASAGAKWGLVVMDPKTGEVMSSVASDRLSFTGSVRKLFSVGMALDTIGPDHRFETPVYRTGAVDAQGALAGDLILVASGDLTFGGRTKPDGSLDFTDFDHNEAHAFGGSGLTPQDPLAAMDDLARQVRASGIQSVSGDVIIDDRLFDGFVVPNGQAFISPMLINENLIDVTLAPGAAAGQPALLDWRPRTSAVTIAGAPTTVVAGAAADIAVTGDLSGTFEEPIHLTCIGAADCKGTIASDANPAAPATIPVGYTVPVLGGSTFVGVLRVEDPASFARSAFIDALVRAGVKVTAPAVAKNPAPKLPASGSYAPDARVGLFTSPRYAEYAKLILKVSLNTGANLSLMHAGLTQGQRTVATALEAERKLLISNIGLDGASFNFPTNGSGSPDSQATPFAVAKLLAAMGTRPSAAAYRDALPLLGVEGSVGAFGKTLAGKGHIRVKSGATVLKGQMVAMNMAGYIQAKSGRDLAFAVFVNDAGPITGLEDTLDVFEDEAQIAGLVYDQN